MRKTLIIAEAGVNHNGDLGLAKKLIDVAAEAGADIVKFQTFKSERIASGDAPKAEYQQRTTGTEESQLDMLRKLELPAKAHRELISYCKSRKIEFLSTPFDLESVDLLVELGLQTFKIPSGELNHLPYLRKIARLNKRIILSTGMADLGEIEDSLEVLVSSGAQRENIVLLHCHSEYPTAMKDVNLLAMMALHQAFRMRVGYSDHTEGIEAPVAAVALGAGVIEKHFTLDKNMPGPDHKASLDPIELKSMVQAIRNIEQALGDGIKKPSPIELKNRDVMRKSIFFIKQLKKGTIIREGDLIMKRPGNGVSPMLMDSVVGKELTRDVKENMLFQWSQVK